MNYNTPTAAANELYCYISNCATAWGQAEHIFRNYERKRAKGTYDATLARKGMLHAVETAARCYVIEHCDRATKWHAMFTPADRRAVADMVMTDTENEWDVGNFWSIAA
jgi:hypothetical protein